MSIKIYIDIFIIISEHFNNICKNFHLLGLKNVPAASSR
jgi:hypothetical protein